MVKKDIKVDALPDSLPIDEQAEPAPPRRPRWQTAAAAVLALVIIAGLLLVGFEKVYSGKVVPGVNAAGVYLGGMTRADAVKAVQAKVNDFSGQQLGLKYNNTIVYIPVSSLDFKFDTEKTVDVAMNYGRQGSLLGQVRSRLRSLFSRSTNVAVYSFSNAKLTPYIVNISDIVDKPVSDATLSFKGGSVKVNPSVSGRRLDLGLGATEIKDHLAHTNSSPVVMPVYVLNPLIGKPELEAAKHQADTFLAGPLKLKVSHATYTAGLGDIISWIKITSSQSTQLGSLSLNDLVIRAVPGVNLEMDRTAIAGYVAGLAAKVDQKGQNAALSIVGGRATVFQPSRDGIALDRVGAINDITEALNMPAEDRDLTLTVAVSHPDVTEENLNHLGIKELISEGVTYFPGSPPNRITNITVGTSKFNGVLLKPGETFSFGKILGDVGPAEGFVPGLVIVGNHEEFQYGGGLCQVASTAFRAALLAGLPITERHNHSYAVFYYTAPFGIPGVDATIFYPQADLKFVNDTGHYILIQTVISGTTLKFDYYGTKTKSGRIRGPVFVTGNSDATKPSHTRFWRDVMNLDGKVTKTDTIDSYYSSSNDFPITKQFN